MYVTVRHSPAQDVKTASGAALAVGPGLDPTRPSGDKKDGFVVYAQTVELPVGETVLNTLTSPLHPY